MFISLPLEFSQPFCLADLPPPAYSSYRGPAPSDSFTVSGLLYRHLSIEGRKITDPCEDSRDRLSLSKLGHPSQSQVGRRARLTLPAQVQASIALQSIWLMGKRCREVDGWRRQTSLILIPSSQAEANADIAGDWRGSHSSDITEPDANHLDRQLRARKGSLEVVSVKLNISLKCSRVVKEMLKGMKVSY